MSSSPEEAAATGTGVEMDIEQQQEPNSQSTTLRKRRSSNKNQNNVKEAKRKSMKSRGISHQEENVFLNMEMRKSQRRRSGKHNNDHTSWIEILGIILFLALIVGLFFDDIDSDTITITTEQLILFTVWFLVCLVVSVMLQGSQFKRLVFWMVVYIPLLCIAAWVVFTGETAGSFKFDSVILIIFIVAEVIAFTSYFTYYYLYPAVIGSKRMRSEPGRVQWFWEIRGCGEDWTMTYMGHRRKRYTAKYEGEINEETGLPDGKGRWLDDGIEGEVVTGYWKDGMPVAPFLSRHYQTGNFVRGTQIIFWKARDDDWDESRFWATNDDPPSYGLASVENNVSGMFYKHLPSAVLTFGPIPVDDSSNPIEECISKLHILDDLEEGNNLTQVSIDASDPRGIQVSGHVYEATGNYFEPTPDNVNVIIQKKPLAQSEGLRRPTYLPRQSQLSFRLNNIIVFTKDENDSDAEADGAPNPELNLPAIDEDSSKRADSNLSSVAASTMATMLMDKTLRVENWIPSTRKEALIFFPGFNSMLQHTLGNFGQFLAMTRLSERIYPIVFSWPGGQVLSYHSAAAAGNNENNVRHLQRLLQSIAAAGIRRVHLLSHSMGVQAMVSSFRDKPDKTRGDVSLCFRLAPDFEEEDDDLEFSSARSSLDKNGNPLLICKTITMLNPDFALDAFVDRGFRSIRRVCNTITLVGDHQDQALYYSMLINGIGTRLGFEQPEPLRPKLASESAEDEPTKKRLQYRKVVGRSIDGLYFPAKSDGKDKQKSDKSIDPRLLFRHRAPMVLRTEDELHDALWLDMDVIDCTGLDTNIAGIRHSAFQLNPVLFNDLEELITTGRRAKNRSTVIHRDGNTYSYAHAPSYVAF